MNKCTSYTISKLDAFKPCTRLMNQITLHAWTKYPVQNLAVLTQLKGGLNAWQFPICLDHFPLLPRMNYPLHSTATSALKMEKVCFSKTASTYMSTWQHNQNSIIILQILPSNPIKFQVQNWYIMSSCISSLNTRSDKCEPAQSSSSRQRPQKNEVPMPFQHSTHKN